MLGTLGWPSGTVSVEGKGRREVAWAGAELTGAERATLAQDWDLGQGPVEALGAAAEGAALSPAALRAGRTPLHGDPEALAWPAGRAPAIKVKTLPSRQTVASGMWPGKGGLQ